MNNIVTFVLIFFIYVTTCAIIPPKNFGIEFTASMSHTIHFKKDKALQNPQWHQAINLYNDFVSKVKTIELCEEEPAIPHIIHQIWLGSSYPEKCKQLRASWLEKHPNWTYILWTEKEIAAFGLQNKMLYDTATNYGEKSDIARYEILCRYGGLYIDTDFECLQSFDFLHQYADFYTGFNCGTHIELFNGLFGCRPNHPILKICIEKLKDPALLKQRANDPMSILDRTGPYFFTRCIYKYINQGNPDNVILFPTTYFYPWPSVHNNEKNAATIKGWIRAESLAIHHWHSAWIH